MGAASRELELRDSSAWSLKAPETEESSGTACRAKTNRGVAVRARFGTPPLFFLLELEAVLPRVFSARTLSSGDSEFALNGVLCRGAAKSRRAASLTEGVDSERIGLGKLGGEKELPTAESLAFEAAAARFVSGFGALGTAGARPSFFVESPGFADSAPG